MDTKTKIEIAKVGIIGLGALGAGYILYKGAKGLKSGLGNIQYRIFTKDGPLNRKITETVTGPLNRKITESISKTKKEIYETTKIYTEPVTEPVKNILNEVKDSKNNPTLTPQPTKKQFTTAGGVIPLFSENSYTMNPSTPREVKGYWGETYLKPEPPAPLKKEIDKLGIDAYKKGRKLSEDEGRALAKALHIDRDLNKLNNMIDEPYKPVIIKKNVATIDPAQRELLYAIARYENNTINDFAQTKKTAKEYKKKIYGGGILDTIRSWF